MSEEAQEHEVLKPKKPVDTRYPKWKFHKDRPAKMIHSEAEEKALGEAWKNSPAEHGYCAHPDPHAEDPVVGDGEQPKPKTRAKPKKE